MSRYTDKADQCTYIAITTMANCADLAVESLKSESPDSLSQTELDLCINSGLDRIERDGLSAHSVMCMASSCLVWLKAHYMSMSDERIEELLEEIDEAEALADLAADSELGPDTDRSTLN
jgi:hypothetical protein